MATIQQRRRQFALRGTSGLLLVGLILILINTLANWVFIRFDLTRSGAYSLSASSRRLVRGLEDPVIIKAYFTPDLPPPYNAFSRYVRDLLTEYKTSSRGKVRYEFVPTYPLKEFEQRAMEANLSPIQFEQMGSDQLQIRRGFMGLVIFYGDKSETLPVIKDISTFEYDVTSRIAKMARRAQKKKQILFTSGHGEVSWRTPQSKLAADAADLYELGDLSLMPATTSAVAPDAVMIVGPSQKFDDKALWVIDQALMKGTPTAVLYDAKTFSAAQFMVRPIDNGLKDLLMHYGIQVGDRLAYDAQCETVGITQNVGGMGFTMSVRYPYVPLITQFDRTHPLLRGIDSIGMPFVVPVEKNPAASGLQFTPLVQTSARSWLAPAESYNVSPNSIPQPAKDDPHGPYIVGAVTEGSFTSYFQGKPLPFPGSTLIGTSPKTSLVVIGTSHVLDPNLPAFQGSEALISNLMAFLTKDDVLIGIRSKGQVMRPLKPVQTHTRDAMKALAMLGVPLMAAGLGILRWRRRQAWRSRIQAAFAPPAVPTAAIS